MRMRYLLLCFISLMLSFGLSGYAQTKAELIKISGKVTDQSMVPLPGVTVKVTYKGDTKGSVTGRDGEFNVITQKGSTLTFTFVGMKKVERVITKNDLHMNIVMEDEFTQLDQVIVTGYTTTTKRRSTGSVTTVSASELKNIPAPNIGMRMQGKIAGVDIKAISGRPGQSAEIHIRGINSISGNTEPLWVVDGVPIEKNAPSLKRALNSADLSTIFTTGIAGINPNDIENITVLKDASATAIYGSRAAGGVIVVTTKSGKAGKLRVNYSANVDIASAPPRSANLMNSREKLAWEKELWDEFSAKRFANGERYPVIGIYGMAMAGKGIFEKMSQQEREDYLAKLGDHTTNWFDELFRTSVSQGHFLSFSGGTQKQTFYFSLGYDNNKGIEIGSSYDRYSFNGKYNVNIGKHVQFGLISDMSMQSSKGAGTSPYSYAYFANPYERPYDENGNYLPDQTYMVFEEVNGQMKTPLPEGGFNIIREMKESPVKAKNFTANLRSNLDITLSEWLRFEGMGSFSYSANYNDAITGKNTYAAFMDRPFEAKTTSKRQYGSITQSSNYNIGYSLRAQLNFHKELGRHYISALAGTEIRGQHNKGIYSKRYDYDPTTGIATLPRPQTDEKIDYSTLNRYLKAMDEANGQTDLKNTMASFYFSADYSYLQKYILSFTARTDGSSSFGTKEQFNPTGSIGLSWHVDKEKFFEKLRPWLSSMTLRASGGYTGNIVNSVYPQLILEYDLYNRRITPDGNYPIGWIKTPPNPKLRWEKTKDYKISLDLGLFNNRLNLSTEFYNRITSDAVTYSVIPSTTGFTQQSFNTSELQNRGVEISLSGSVINTKKWGLSAYGNFSYNENKLTKYNSPSESLSSGQHVGYPLGGLMTGKVLGIDPITGMYIFQKRADAKMEKESDRQAMENYLFYLGTRHAPYNGGCGVTLTYDNFSLHVSGSYSIDGKVLNNISSPTGAGNLGSGKVERVPTPRNDLYRNFLNQEKDVRHRWTPDNPITDGYPRLIDAYGDRLMLDKYMPVGSMITNGALFEDVSYFKINTIMLSYSFDSKARWMKQVGISGLGLSFSANNVAIFSNYTGLDPETPGAVYPMARSYSFGLNVEF